MKNFLSSIVFIGLTIYLGKELYERSKDRDWFQSGGDVGQSIGNLVAPSYSFPVVTELSRNDGKSLRVKLLGRNSSKVQFERLSDGQTFLFSISELSPESQELLDQYPLSGLVNADAHLRKGELSLDQAYIEQLREEISEIDQELKRMEGVYSASESSVERRTIKRKAEQMRSERAALEKKISER